MSYISLKRLIKLKPLARLNKERDREGNISKIRNEAGIPQTL